MHSEQLYLYISLKLCKEHELLKWNTQEAKKAVLHYFKLEQVNFYILIFTCPCPSEIVWHFPEPNPWSSANLRRPAMGSAPGDSTKMRGEQQFESAKLPARSKVGGSMYCRPIESTMKF